MKMLVDFFPIAIFFLVYHLTKDIVTATAVLIPATVLQVLYTWWRHRKVEKMHLVTLALVVVLGGATVLFGNGDFIKWKPTIVNWLFAVAFLFSPLFGGKALTQRMMEKSITLPSAVWMRLNLAWVAFFAAMGALNIYVFTHYSEETWVNFKLFGMMGLTILFILVQGVFLARHMPRDGQNGPSTTKKDEL
ncbi:septation protein A [Phytohalomonas tamaricis]|uniref:septation protein A n=1 Tax=Phytohalomonas tamaricis TaxID=2081032 RepID=UPI000D0AD437|nr:septation protein A [Phytohalomonas tamaricis]